MGMGEPMLNLPNVVAAARRISSALQISGRSVTISTVGVPGTLARLAAERLTATLAVSLHAPEQQLRESIIPSARVYHIDVRASGCVWEGGRGGRAAVGDISHSMLATLLYTPATPHGHVLLPLLLLTAGVAEGLPGLL